MMTSLTTYSTIPAHTWWHLWQPIAQHLYTDDHIFDNTCTQTITSLTTPAHRWYFWHLWQPKVQHLHTDDDIFDNLSNSTCTQMMTSLVTYHTAPALSWNITTLHNLIFNDALHISLHRPLSHAATHVPKWVSDSRGNAHTHTQSHNPSHLSLSLSLSVSLHPQPPTPIITGQPVKLSAAKQNKTKQTKTNKSGPASNARKRVWVTNSLLNVKVQWSRPTC